MAVVNYKLGQGVCDYNRVTNSCVSNVADVMRGAGLPVPPSIYFPMELRNWFINF